MPWFRDSQSPHGPKRRTVVVLGLVVTVILAVLAETPLGGSTAAPAWLHLGTAGSTAGSVLPPAGDLGAPALAAAKKRKRHKLLAAGDIASCSSSGDEATAKLRVWEQRPDAAIMEPLMEQFREQMADISAGPPTFEEYETLADF